MLCLNPDNPAKWRGEICFYLTEVLHFGGGVLYWPGGVSVTLPTRPRPFLLSLRHGRGIISVSARRPPPRQPLLSSAACVSTFLWTNTALNNSVCFASTCLGAAVQTRLRGRGVWYPNPGLMKEAATCTGPTDSYVIPEMLTDYPNIHISQYFVFPGDSFISFYELVFYFKFISFIWLVVNSNLCLSMLYFYYWLPLASFLLFSSSNFCCSDVWFLFFHHRGSISSN